jgi:hypothetical protein
MKILKKVSLGLAALSFVFSNPGFILAATGPATIDSAQIFKPVVSVDGVATQKAVVVVTAPGGLDQIKDVTVKVNTPDIIQSSVGSFTWSPALGFIENEGATDGSEYVDLIEPDARFPDTTSQVSIVTNPLIAATTLTAASSAKDFKLDSKDKNDNQGKNKKDDKDKDDKKEDKKDDKCKNSKKNKGKCELQDEDDEDEDENEDDDLPPPPPPAPASSITATITFIWTLDRSLGSTFDNDITVNLTENVSALGSLFIGSARADAQLVLDSSFDTNTPPDVTPISDVPVAVSEVAPADVDVTVVATDIDSDPITYAMIEGPTDGSFNIDTFSWDPTVEDIGTQNVQIIATDPYGVTTVDFDVIVELPPIPETGSWTAVSQVGAPEGRVDHSIVWDGADQTLVWGGTVADGTRSSTGGVYHQSTDSWTPISSALNNFAASQHVAVWTGSEMLVWGGLDFDNNATNQGQLYDPATDTWRAMSTVNAPSPRYEATGVWTGSKLFVWGGVSVTAGVPTWYNDGAMYDLATDTWTPVSTVSLSPRQTTGGVLTASGSQIILWGGLGWSPATGTTYHIDGGIYDLATDTWSLIDSTGMFEGRTGYAMVPISDTVTAIWGGFNDGGMLNSGTKYDLFTQSWIPLSADLAPSSRSNFAVAGGPGKLIIWGGYDGADILSSGGIYDLDQDSWLATSSVNAPAAKQGAVGVMQNGTAFFWGGIGAGASYEATGGVFTP